MQDDAPRASPDALLAHAEREGRGKLRLFLGAAPGVGKTYAMLGAARAARAGGRDVLVGIVETHGRADTEAMVADLEVLPRKPIPYRGRLVPEFDIDAALARRPSLLLVDEYAHSNVEGSRHPKRWQDVAECLKAGIDVWTTMNVQHVESLNDVVQRITGVRVRETVPDTTLEVADEIVLVDLPSDELIRRLAEGKVYVEDTATRATQNFFKPSNLTALRELALRQVAAQVDSDLVERMQGGAIEGPWAAGERLLVCIGPDRQAERLVREGKRLADLLDAPWFAVTIERPGAVLEANEASRLDASLQLAKSLGAETHSLVAADLPAEILRFSRFENVTQIVVGKARSRRLKLPWSEGNLADALVGRAKGVSVLVLTESEAPPPRSWSWPEPGGWIGYGTAAGSVALATLLGTELVRFVPLPNVSMLYLLAVLTPALLYGVWSAVFASFLSFGAYNFFFIDPRGTFTVARPHEVLALVVFLIIAVAISAVAGQAREQMRASARRTRAARRLYEFTRTLSALPDVGAVAEAAATEINAAIGRAVTILRPDAGDLAIAAAWPPDDRLDVPARTAARWAHEHGEKAGAGTQTLPSSGWTFLPLAVQDSKVGVLGIERPPGAESLDAEVRTLLSALAEQTAAALHRALLSTEVRSARTAAETERVRNILLASISHDFRTPLASILGSATALIDYRDRLDAAARDDLLAQVRDEARQLDQMVRNLLSMTRLEAGALEITKDWVDIREMLERQVDQARRRGATQRFSVDLPPEPILAFGDGTLLDQAVGNVVGNAVKHAGANAGVTLRARAEPGGIAIEIADDGPGVPPDLREHVFEKFTRMRTSTADGGDSAGLGLAITKGIVEAHGGTVELLPPDAARPRGAAFLIRLPSERAPTP
ncbi:sensor histidine kinase [Aureimonas jatrophae]|uniref:histidine kinase n=1 Tax=Aureimonas jatrophae TaxID=1166073 RepID=A0A1H0HZK6_9HYPH|nr:sensor histidine kinase KdpD [Aureimonas jatrophae]MBB3950850.1 two-component system sensor histidine kinase KdpD [Aureimonas jatrophae]SDO24310.1 osmosensitive K+ channel signal transduction histidine kinase [Aureimonas jatrophae]